MTVQTGTATDHADLFADLRTFLTTSTGSGGAGWTELVFNAGQNRVLLRAPGLSGTDAIHVGLGYVADVGLDAYALTGWMFQEYQPTFDTIAQPGTSVLGFQPLINTAMPYWFVANAQRVMVITKVSTRYFASYLGKFLPYGAPGEYPQPYYMAMPSASNTRWSENSQNIRNFWDPSTSAKILHPSGAWVDGGNHFNATGNAEGVLASSGAFVWPYACNVTNNIDETRYRELRENLDGTYPRFRLQLVADNPSNDIWGELDGAYAVPAFSAQSEDILQIDGVDHLIVQDTFRTERHNYAAIALS